MKSLTPGLSRKCHDHPNPIWSSRGGAGRAVHDRDDHAERRERHRLRSNLYRGDTGPRGLAAEGAGAVVNATNFNINLSHTGSTRLKTAQVFALSMAACSRLVGGTVTMTGDWNHGIVASGGTVDTNAGCREWRHDSAAKLMEPSPSANRFRNSALRQSFCAPVHRSPIIDPIRDRPLLPDFPRRRSRQHATVLTAAAVAATVRYRRTAEFPAWRLGNDHRQQRSHGLYTFAAGSLIVADAAFGGVRTSGPTAHGAGA